MIASHMHAPLVNWAASKFMAPGVPGCALTQLLTLYACIWQVFADVAFAAMQTVQAALLSPAMLLGRTTEHYADSSRNRLSGIRSVDPGVQQNVSTSGATQQP